MTEREHGAGRLMPQPDKGLPFSDALAETTRDHNGALATLDDDAEYRRLMAIGLRVMRQHRNVLAALAESEQRDREAEVGHANVRRGLMV